MQQKEKLQNNDKNIGSSATLSQKATLLSSDLYFGTINIMLFYFYTIC